MRGPLSESNVINYPVTEVISRQESKHREHARILSWSRIDGNWQIRVPRGYAESVSLADGPNGPRITTFTWEESGTLEQTGANWLCSFQYG